MDNQRFKLSEDFWQKTPEGFSSLYEWNINPVKMACNIFLRQRSKIVLAEALSGNSHDTLLDLGCGSGDLGISLSNAFQKIILSDYSEGMLDIARKNISDQTNIKLICNDATDIPVEDKSIDKTIAIGLLDYVKDIGAVLTEVSRVSKPGSTLIITAPKSPTIFQFLRVSSAFRKSVSGLPPIVNSMTKLEFENLLFKHEFKPLKMNALWDAMWIVTAQKPK